MQSEKELPAHLRAKGSTRNSNKTDNNQRGLNIEQDLHIKQALPTQDQSFFDKINTGGSISKQPSSHLESMNAPTPRINGSLI